MEYRNIFRRPMRLTPFKTGGFRDVLKSTGEDFAAWRSAQGESGQSDSELVPYWLASTFILHDQALAMMAAEKLAYDAAYTKAAAEFDAAVNGPPSPETAAIKKQTEAIASSIKAEMQSYASAHEEITAGEAPLYFAAAKLETHDAALKLMRADAQLTYQAALRKVEEDSAKVTPMKTAGGVADGLTACKAGAGFDPHRLRLHELAIAYQGRNSGTSYAEAVDAVSRAMVGPDDHITACKATADFDEGRIAIHERAIAYQVGNPGTSYVDALEAIGQTA